MAFPLKSCDIGWETWIRTTIHGVRVFRASRNTSLKGYSG